MTILKKLTIAAVAVVWMTWMLPTASLAVKIGIVWMGESSMTERIEKGFIEEFPKLAPDADIERHHIEDIQGYEALEKTVRRFEKEKDGMLVLRSNGAQWLSENRTSIPTFIGATNNPAVIGAVKNLDEPEGNVTGVTYYLPHQTQFEVFKLLIPDMKSILLLLQKGHASTLVDRRGTRKACREMGIEYNEVESASIDDSIAAIKAHKDKISAVIIGTNNINVERTPAIVEAAGDIPVLAYTDKPVKNGALAGLVPNDAKRARLLAESVYEVLVNKKPIKEVPVKFDPDPKFLINPAAAERYGVNVTYEVLKFATVLE
jgi:putative tryptophan/tyrosine transport system substrate-binding protein